MVIKYFVDTTINGLMTYVEQNVKPGAKLTWMCNDSRFYCVMEYEDVFNARVVAELLDEVTPTEARNKREDEQRLKKESTLNKGRIK